MRARGALPALLVPALLASGGAARAAAQDSWTAHVNATVRVAPPPILLETTRDLYFGSVGPGSDVVVPAQPPYTAGTWAAGVRFNNLRKTVEYGIRFTLPANLTNGGTTLPVSWNGTEYGWLCVWNSSSGSAAACAVQQQSFDPSAHTSGSGVVVDLPNNTPGNNNFVADVYVGGRLTVPNVASLPPGTYTAPLTVTITVLN